MTRNPEYMLSTAKYHFGIALQHGERDLTDQLTTDAISMRILAGIDALSGLPLDSRDALVGDIWANLRGMRNRLAHAYDTVDPDLIGRTVRGDLPELMRRLDAFTPAGERT